MPASTLSDYTETKQRRDLKNINASLVPPTDTSVTATPAAAAATSADVAAGVPAPLTTIVSKDNLGLN